MDKNLVPILAVLVICGCGSNDPCTELCDGIARCREGNATCVSEGMTARDPFMMTCVAQCESSALLLDASQEVQAQECLDCLRAETNFGLCDGEMLLDDTCAATCRSDGAGAFRDDFGPAIFSEFSCLRSP